MSKHAKDWALTAGALALGATGLGAAGIGPLAGMMGAGAAGAGAGGAAGGLLGAEGAAGTAAAFAPTATQAGLLGMSAPLTSADLMGTALTSGGGAAGLGSFSAAPTLAGTGTEALGMASGASPSMLASMQGFLGSDKFGQGMKAMQMANAMGQQQPQPQAIVPPSMPRQQPQPATFYQGDAQDLRRKDPLSFAAMLGNLYG